MNEYLDFNYNKNKKIKLYVHVLAITFVVALFIAILPLLPIVKDGYTANAAPSASGKTNASIQLRKGPSTSTQSLGTLKTNQKVTITCEVFTTTSSADASTRWYAVKVGKKSGYIKVERVKNISYSKARATTMDYLNYREGPSTKMRRLGTAPFGDVVMTYLPAKVQGSGETWYKVYIGGRYCYMIGSYLDFANSNGAKNIKADKNIANKLRAKATKGGKARYVYTLNTKNCGRKFMITGHGKGMVPQGMAYSGKEYYIVFGMSGGQSVVSYNSSGMRTRALKIPYKMGKPNGMTWDPLTGLCYIIKGSQRKIYTWNPKNGKFGTAKMPYSSSGLAYDKVTKKIYASSLTAIRVYSADGKFKHKKQIKRCSHKGKTYVQDCGAYGGYIFHVLSSSNKFGTNYIDVYKDSGSKYLGSIKVNLGAELESVIVDNEGFVELMANHGGTYCEYVWKTPLNVKDLM